MTWIEKIVHLKMLPWMLLLSGCVYNGKDIADDLLKRSPDTWSSRDCLIIVMLATRENLSDKSSPNIKVVATVYSPSVIMANYRRAHILGRHHKTSQVSLPKMPPAESLESMTDSEYISSLDVLMEEEAGVYYDWQTDRYVDSRGNYLKSYTQLDSLTLFVNIENWGWLWYMADITNLENQIYLVNDQNKFIRRMIVWGRRQAQLVSAEHLIVKFRIRKDDYHFLEHSNSMRLMITGFDSKIMLDFPVSLLR